MKIFIIGPEGSGKTVLLVMLSRYVANQRKDLVLEALDRPSAVYVIDGQTALEKGEWPPGTVLGKIEALKWRFGARGKLHEIELTDTAGQDLCRILTQDDRTSLTPRQQEIRNHIDLADVLVYLLDLKGFQGSIDLAVCDENAWMLKTFLTRPEWRKKHRAVVLSKADEYQEQLDASGGTGAREDKIKALVKESLPKNYTLEHLVDQEAHVSYLAVASVRTELKVVADGNQRLVPKRPLESVGMGDLVKVLEGALWGINIRKWLIWATLLLASIALAWGLIESFRPIPCLACGASGTINCPKCKGTSKVSFRSWDPCKRCDGTGKILLGLKDCPDCKTKGGFDSLETKPCGTCVSGQVACPKCFGKKTVPRWRKMA